MLFVQAVPQGFEVLAQGGVVRRFARYSCLGTGIGGQVRGAGHEGLEREQAGQVLSRWWSLAWKRSDRPESCWARGFGDAEVIEEGAGDSECHRGIHFLGNDPALLRGRLLPDYPGKSM